MMELWEEIGPLMLSFTIGKGAQVSDAEDIVNTVFLKVWPRHHALSPKTIRMYCWRVLFNLINRRGRGKWLRFMNDVDAAGEAGTEQIAIYKDLLRYLKGTLTSDQYSALLMSVDSIRGHEMTSGAFRATLFRARRKLKGLEDYLCDVRSAS